MTDAGAIADEVLKALASRDPVEPFTARVASFDDRAAYAVTSELRRRRSERGEMPIGRKIGFTNRNIWAEYGVYEPIWGDIYATTAHDVQPGARARISHLPQPRIEPEIVLGLDGDLSGDMSAEDVAERIGWVAHGFEIVQSIFPDWKCSVADCVADGGLHGALFIGPRKPLSAVERRVLPAILPKIGIELFRDGRPIDAGIGSNVLGGPVQALKYLVDVLARDPLNPSLRAGEFISTGTITRAFPVSAGERWSTRLTGFDLPGMDVELY
ncbi:MAG: hydratase [Rhizobiaceae bacterium]|nr:hydratase [Rhizobiaceae bacterium]